MRSDKSEYICSSNIRRIVARLWLMNKQPLPEAVKLGKRLREYRRSHGITQEQLAEKVGVSYEWIGRVERGLYFPNWFLLIKIAKVLRVKVQDLIPF